MARMALIEDELTTERLVSPFQPVPANAYGVTGRQGDRLPVGGANGHRGVCPQARS